MWSRALVAWFSGCVAGSIAGSRQAAVKGAGMGTANSAHLPTVHFPSLQQLLAQLLVHLSTPHLSLPLTLECVAGHLQRSTAAVEPVP